MYINTETIFSMTQANQNFSVVARAADRNGEAVVFKNNRPKYLVVNLESSGRLLDDLIQFVYGGRNCRLVLIGDVAQLPPVGEELSPALSSIALEGYGMTETAPVISVKNSKRPRINNVGVIFPDFDVKIVAEKDGQIASDKPLKAGKKGLILVRGRQIMKGYYKRDDLTNEIIDKDGWLNTGDLGMISYDKELKIVGRAKDTIVLLGGENIEPAVIEKALNSSSYIERSVVLGQDKKYVAALIVPDDANILSYAEENGIVFDNYEALLETNEIQNLIRTEIDTLVNAKMLFHYSSNNENHKIII